jgi:hypothetical protein
VGDLGVVAVEELVAAGVRLYPQIVCGDGGGNGKKTGEE